MGTISADGITVLIIIIEIVVVGIATLRQWIIRNQARSLFVNVADAFIWAFVSNFIVIGALMIDNSAFEKRVTRQWSEPADAVLYLNTPDYLKKFTACTILYTAELWLLKFGFLAYFFRLRQHFSRTTKFLIYATTIYSLLTFVAMIVIQLVGCRPFNRNWAPPPQNCMVLETVWGSTLQAWLNMTADLMVLAISLLAISSLQLGRRERIALLTVACLGSVSIVMCLVRFIEVYKTLTHPGNNNIERMRRQYMWAAFETTFSFVAFCLPSLRVLLRQTKIFQRSKVASSSNRMNPKSKSTMKIQVSKAVDITFIENNSQVQLQNWEQPWESNDSNSQPHVSSPQRRDPEWN